MLYVIWKKVLQEIFLILTTKKGENIPEELNIWQHALTQTVISVHMSAAQKGQKHLCYQCLKVCLALILHILKNVKTCL